MFKKSNRNFRSKKVDFDDSDENDSQNSRSNESDLTQSKKTTAETATILSFENETIDDEYEEFKVKKSKESRRIAKELKKSKKEKQKQNTNEQKNFTGSEDLYIKKTNISIQEIAEVENEDIFFKVKPLDVNRQESKKTAKFLVNKYKTNTDDENEEIEEVENLQRLRKEMEVLNGEEVDPIEDESDEARRSMKLMLKVGIIPDAAQIHAARKKRELARQGDYIPINNNNNNFENSKSRLIREDDENDLSEDEDNQAEANIMSLNFKEKVHIERQTNRDNFLAYENGSDNESLKNDYGEKNDDDDDDDEDEEERWEKEQIRKGVQLFQGNNSRLDNNKGNKKYMQNYFLNSNITQEPMDIDDSKMYDLEQLNNLPEITFFSIKSLIKKNISLLDEKNQAHLTEHKMRLENLTAHKTDLENLKILKPSLDEQYVYYQEIKAFIQDFIDCYDEKLNLIDEASSTFISLLKKRADFITKRRQQDFKDQSLECSAKRGVLDSSHEQRINEREKRLSKKSLKRDDLLSDEDDVEYISKEEILDNLKQQVINDINEEFYKFQLIKKRFENWKSISLESYRTTYVSYSLPKLFSPLIKYELADWNPLKEYRDLETFNWFSELITFDKQNMLKHLNTNDISKLDDSLLIPHIVEKTVILHLIEIIDNVYDPMSTTQTKNITKLILKLIYDYPTLNSKSENTKRLFECIVSRIRKCLDNDIYIPLYSKQVIEQRNSNSSIFFYRQFWSCTKLFSNLISWKGIINDKLVKEFSLDCLLNRYLMIGLQTMEHNGETINNIEYLISKLPKEWLNLNTESTLPQLTNIIRLIKRIADSLNKDVVLINRIKILFINIGATDQATSL